MRLELESVRAQLQATREAVAQDQATQSELQALQLSHTQKLDSAHAELDCLQLSHAQELSLVRSELAAMERQSAAQAAQLQDLQQQHAEAQIQAQQASDAAAMLAESQAKADCLKATQNDLSQQLAAAQTQHAETQQQLESAQREAESSVAEQQEASAELQRLQAELVDAEHAKHDLVNICHHLHVCFVCLSTYWHNSSTISEDFIII